MRHIEEPATATPDSGSAHAASTSETDNLAVITHLPPRATGGVPGEVQPLWSRPPRLRSARPRGPGCSSWLRAYTASVVAADGLAALIAA